MIYNKDMPLLNRNFLGDLLLGLYFLMELIFFLFGIHLYRDLIRLLIMALYLLDIIRLSMWFLKNLFCLLNFFGEIIVMRINILNGYLLKAKMIELKKIISFLYDGSLLKIYLE
jgi:hypothetical protein